MAKKGLGKGLDALFGDNFDEQINTEESKNFIEVKLSQIDPNREQPRKNFDEEKIKELSESILENGLVQPIILTKEGKRYKIIAGERRFRAARLAGLTTVPAIIRENLDNKKILEFAIIENIQRQDLDPIEEASAYRALMDEHSMTQEMVAKKVGKSRPAIANALRLLNLDSRVQSMLIEGRISETHARALVTLEDKDMQYKIALDIEKMGLNSRDIEALMRQKKSKGKKKVQNIFAKDLEDKFKNYFGTKVKVVTKSKEKGKIVIEYMSNDDLDRIMGIIGIDND